MNKKTSRLRRARRNRAQILRMGKARLTVHRTGQHIYAQVIDAQGGKVVAAASTLQKDVAKDFITRWCRAIATNEGDKFEKEWGLQERVLETPQKRRRGSHAPGNADADSD